MTTSPSKTQSDRTIDSKTAMKMACRFILGRMQSYQVMPMTDDGHIDWEAYKPNETRWNLIRHLAFKDIWFQAVSTPKGDYWRVTLIGEWAWSDDDYVESDFHFEVCIPKDANPDTDNDFEFESYV